MKGSKNIMENKTIEDYIVNQLNSIDTLHSELNDLQIDYNRLLDDYEELKREIFKLFNLDKVPNNDYGKDEINEFKLINHNTSFSPYHGVYGISKYDTPIIFKYVVRQWQNLKEIIEDEKKQEFPEEDESEIIDHE